jgi:putative aldouronate transport system permease protein
MEAAIRDDKKPGGTKNKSFWYNALQQKYLYFMTIPFVIWVFIFSYVPIFGWIMAFQRYRPGLGRTIWKFWKQDFVGFKHFIDLFSDDRFFLVIRNTLAMSSMALVASFTVPILFAVLLNELRNQLFKRVIQTVSYLPHFVSWVVVAGIVTKMLSIDGGVINDMLVGLHIIDKPILFMSEGKYFWSIVTASDLWKEMGWTTIIYLAAITGIDPEQYEAARIDGAGRWRTIWHITLPGIRTTISILLIMSIGHLIQIGFEKQFLLGNPRVIDYSEVLDLYALNNGITQNRYSFGTAISMFNSIVSIILLFAANGIFKRVTKESIM